MPTVASFLDRPAKVSIGPVVYEQEGSLSPGPLDRSYQPTGKRPPRRNSGSSSIFRAGVPLRPGVRTPPPPSWPTRRRTRKDPAHRPTETSRARSHRWPSSWTAGAVLV
jgi:hypothetical protein